MCAPSAPSAPSSSPALASAPSAPPLSIAAGAGAVGAPDGAFHCSSGSNSTAQRQCGPSGQIQFVNTRAGTGAPGERVAGRRVPVAVAAGASGRQPWDQPSSTRALIIHLWLPRQPQKIRGGCRELCQPAPRPTRAHKYPRQHQAPRGQCAPCPAPWGSTQRRGTLYPQRSHRPPSPAAP
jgi:hypothetical protein